MTTKTMNKNFIKKIFPMILLLIMIAPFFALAAELPPYTLMSGPIQGLTNEKGTVPTDNPAVFLISLYWYIFGLGVALAVLMIVWGGIGYTLKWTEFMATDSKNRITNAVIGLVILFTSWLILYTINTNLVGFNVDLSKEGCNSPLAGNAGGKEGPTGGTNYNAGTRDSNPRIGRGAPNYINKETLRTQLTEKLKNSKLNGFVPSDGAAYGITTGSPEEWANYLTELAGVESSYNNVAAGDIGRFGTGSNGLFQLSQNDAPRYKLNGGKDFTMEQLQNPDTNMSAAISIQESLIRRTGSIEKGAGQYWGPIQRGWLPYIPKPEAVTTPAETTSQQSGSAQQENGGGITY